MKRDWLRSQLKQFQFKKVQQSVWHGPSVIPQEFMDYLDTLGIKEMVKFFRTRDDI